MKKMKRPPAFTEVSFFAITGYDETRQRGLLYRETYRFAAPFNLTEIYAQVKKTYAD